MKKEPIFSKEEQIPESYITSPESPHQIQQQIQTINSRNNWNGNLTSPQNQAYAKYISSLPAEYTDLIDVCAHSLIGTTLEQVFPETKIGDTNPTVYAFYNESTQSLAQEFIPQETCMILEFKTKVDNSHVITQLLVSQKGNAEPAYLARS